MRYRIVFIKNGLEFKVWAELFQDAIACANGLINNYPHVELYDTLAENELIFAYHGVDHLPPVR